MTISRKFLLAPFVCALSYAQSDFREAITKSYEATLSGLREVKTKAELQRLVDAIDVPEWQASLPSGAVMTRPEAIESLSGLLAMPSESRPAPRQHIVYMTETGWSVLVVYWIYQPVGRQLVGSLARDTWARTSQGWRRIRHEKLFPERPLVEDGKGLILPAQ
jgi:hypothetical protein